MSKRKFPPDPERKNGARAEWAAQVVAKFQELTGVEDEYALGDLICDLGHFADRNPAFGRIAKAVEFGLTSYLEETDCLGEQFKGVRCE